MLAQIRTDHAGTNSYFKARKVPGKADKCDICGSQEIRLHLLLCHSLALRRRRLEEFLRQAGHLTRYQHITSFKPILNEPKFAIAVTTYLRARFPAGDATLSSSTQPSPTPPLPHLAYSEKPTLDNNARQHGLSPQTSLGSSCSTMFHDSEGAALTVQHLAPFLQMTRLFVIPACIFDY